MIIPLLEMTILRFREVHRPSRFGPCEIKGLVVRKAVCPLKAKGGSKEVIVKHVCCQAVWVQSLIYQWWDLGQVTYSVLHYCLLQNVYWQLLSDGAPVKCLEQCPALYRQTVSTCTLPTPCPLTMGASLNLTLTLNKTDILFPQSQLHFKSLTATWGSWLPDCEVWPGSIPVSTESSTGQCSSREGNKPLPEEAARGS